nr:serine hydrolase domain-containing protein [Phenylobacterium aquaticum]
MGVALWAALGAAQAAAAEDPTAKAVDAILATYDRKDAPAVSVSVYRDGAMIYSRALGMANLEYGQPATAQTVFDVASVSKEFTAYAIALLERDGKVDAGADIHRYLPELPDYGHPLTVADLIHHTGGLRDTNILLDLAQRDSSARLTQAQMVRLIARQTSLRYVPGAEFSYSNTDYILLAEIVRRVSGQSLRAFTEARIFRPLGMTHTYFRDDVTAVVPGAASPYAPTIGAGWRRWIYNVEYLGSTGLETTSEDLLKWIGYLDRPPQGDESLVAKITAPAKLSTGAPVNYGYGLWRQRYAGRDAISHTGAIAGYRALIVWLPKEHFGLAVTSNMPIDVGTPAERIIDAYLGKPPADPADAAAKHKEDAAPITPDAEVLKGLAGRYVPEGIWSVDLVAADGKLYWASSTQPKTPVTLRERDLFTRGQGDGMRWFRFVRDPKGAVIGFEALTDVGGQSLGGLFRRAPVYAAPPQALTELEGDYYSREVDATYTFTVKDGRLVARSLWSNNEAHLYPVMRDRFDTDVIGLGVLQVERDRAHRVIGLRIVGGGLSGMRLVRTAGAGR